MATAMQIALEIVQSLPEDCTLAEAAYRLYLRQLIEEVGSRELPCHWHL